MDKELHPLLHWLLQRYPETPRSRAKQWIESGRVAVDGVVIRKPHHLISDPGALLQLDPRQIAPISCASGWRIHPRVNLLYLDPSLAIVDKGAGLLSVSARTTELSALSILEDFLSGKLKPRETRSGLRLPEVFRHLHPLPVHRLDQFTSGVFCLAMNPDARAKLIEQVRAHTMRREYIAFVQGRPSVRKGTWRNWLRLSEGGLRQNVVADPGRTGSPVSKGREGESKEVRPHGRRAPYPGKSDSRIGASRPATAGLPDVELAITHFELLDEYPASEGKCIVSKLRLQLETGLKHQIRIQAAHAGLPLIGDRTYHPSYRRGAEPTGGLPVFDRQALHSETLTLEHPERPGQTLTWRAELPSDLQKLQADLRSSRI